MDALMFGSLTMFARRRPGELAEAREIVRQALIFAQPFGKVGDDAPGERDVGQRDFDAGAFQVRLDDG